jgi:hypothetical protein
MYHNNPATLGLACRDVPICVHPPIHTDIYPFTINGFRIFIWRFEPPLSTKKDRFMRSFLVIRERVENPAIYEISRQESIPEKFNQNVNLCQ